jgi:hypothetical protein
MKLQVTTILAVLFLLGDSATYAQEIFEEAPELFSTRQLTDRISGTAENKIVIQSVSTLRGSITITATKQEQISISYYKKAKAETESRAIDFIDLIAIRLERVASEIRVQLSAPNPAPWRDQEDGLVDAQLSVPESCLVEVEATYFDVTANGPLAAVLVPSSLGRLEITDVTQQLKLETSNRRVSLKEISGDVSVTTSNADLSATEISCPASPARFQNDGGDIRIDGFTGAVNIKNSYGRVEISDFDVIGGGNYIRGLSGPIVIEIGRITDGQVIISNRFEDIDITVPSDLSARFSLDVDEGSKIEVTNFPFKTDLVNPTRLNLVTGDGAAFISASVRGSGNIYVRAAGEGE